MTPGRFIGAALCVVALGFGYALGGGAAADAPGDGAAAPTSLDAPGTGTTERPIVPAPTRRDVPIAALPVADDDDRAGAEPTATRQAASAPAPTPDDDDARAEPVLPTVIHTRGTLPKPGYASGGEGTLAREQYDNPPRFDGPTAVTVGPAAATDVVAGVATE